MRYLTISADYRSSGIKDQDSELHRGDIEVPDLLWEMLQKWVADYSSIVMMDLQERANASSEISQLDLRGLQLVEDFRNALGPDVKIRYYSEGLLRYLK